MARTVKPRRYIKLVIMQDRDGDYYHINLRFAWCTIDGKDEPYEYRPFNPREPEFDNLLITSQGNNRDEPRNLYAWKLSYRNLYSVQLFEMSRMCRTLKRFTRSDENSSQPQSFSEFVERIAKDAGVSFIQRSTSGPIYSVAKGIQFIDYLERKWKSENGNCFVVALEEDLWTTSSQPVG